MYSPLKASLLSEQIVEQIEKHILEGSLTPGTKLPSERELGEQFAVSRTAVREAIKALREKGLVAVQPGRGTFVVGDSTTALRRSLDMLVKFNKQSDLDDLVVVRAILEPEIAAIATEKATEDNIAKLEQSVQVMDEAMDDADRFIEADQAFHLELAVATQNFLIPALNDMIVDYLWTQRKQIFLVEGGPQRGQYHHKLILAAVRDRDPEAAREAMRAHMQQVREDTGMATD